MDARILLALVQDVAQWRGDVYQLAKLIEASQKEYDASLLEAAGQADSAELIRTQ